MDIDFICNIWKVEHGSAGIIITPNNKLILFDAGRSDDFSPAEHLHNNWPSAKADKLVISHPHDDHIQDLPNVIALLEPDSRVKNPHTPERLVYPSGKANLKEPTKSWLDMEDRFTATVTDANRFNNALSWGGVQFNSYSIKEEHLSGRAKDNLNNYSLLATAKYKGLVIVFPGDLEPDGWDAMLDNTALAKNIDGSIKILVAPHHGRRSGVRKADGSVYSRFLDLLKPDLVIISDIWGNETTDPEAYKPYCSGLDVEFDGVAKECKVLTTKTNDCVSIQVVGATLTVKAL